MKRTKIFFVALLLLFVSNLTFAQNLTVSGVVKDAATGEPIPFAAIQVKNTMNGANADENGSYTIYADKKAVLVFTSIGYLTLEVPVAGKLVHDISLLPDSKILEGTVVTAYGTSTKEAFTGSATAVKSSEISKVQVPDATRALEGVVSGVQLTTSSGTLGKSPSLIIRGIGSISAETKPLYVLDGIPYEGDMNNLNPSDIESITVLKDAASNSLYGARGANGVVMITTKRAKAGDAVVTFESRYGLNTKALKTYDYITDPRQYYETHYKALYNRYTLVQSLAHDTAHNKAAADLTSPTADGSLRYLTYTVPTGQFLIGSNGKFNPYATEGRVVVHDGKKYFLTPDNWMDETYKKSFRQEYNLSISGMTGKASIYSSFGFLKDNGIIEGADMSRFTANLKADYQAKHWLKIGATAVYTNFNFNNGNTDEGSFGSTGNVFSFAATVAPIYPLYIRDENGNILKDDRGYKKYDYGAGEVGNSRPVSSNSNALSDMLLNVNNSKGNAFNASTYSEFRFLKNLKFTLKAGLSLDETLHTSMKNMYYGQYAAQGGSISKEQSSFFAVNLQQLLDYNVNIAKSHNISVLLGHEYYRKSNATLYAAKSKLFSLDILELNGAIVDSKSAYSKRTFYNSEGYFSRLQYDYAGRVFASASYRLDATSKFHPKHRWGSFWSLGSGWLINKEKWFNFSWVDMLKLRASVGSQGNDSIPDFLYTDMFTITNNNDEFAVKFKHKGNEKITWETNVNFNLGFDYELLGSTLRGSFEYFYRKTKDMLFFFPVPLSLGYNGYYDNIGDMRNAGIEFSLNATAFRNKNINWDLYCNFTHYTNKVVRLPEEKKTVEVEGYKGYASGTKFVGEGLPYNTFKLKKYAGVNPDNGMPRWYKDEKDTEGKVNRVMTEVYTDATEYLCGNPTPALYGGFGTSLDFYGFDFGIQFSYSIGGKMYDYGYAHLMDSPGSSVGHNIHKDILKAWTPENKDSDIPRFVYKDQNIAAASDRFLTDASYLNVQNIQIGYTLPKRLTEKFHTSRLRFYGTCNNVAYWSRRKGLDPRQSFSGSSDDVSNSPVRTFSLGLSLTF